jgi:hypothetical protein
MKILNISLNLILFSTLTPILGSILDISFFNLPFLILVLITSIILLSNDYKFKIEYDLLFTTFLITIISLIFSVLFSRGFTILALGGYVILSSFLFQNIYLLHKKLAIKNILNFFNFFYKCFLIILAIEFFLVLNGYQEFLNFILDGKPSYKNYNGFDVGRFFSSKFDYIGGLNSIFLGSQIAGTISLLSFIWFNTTKKLNFFYYFKKFAFWKYLSLFFFIVTLNGTNFFLFLILLLFLVFNYFKNFINKLFFLFILTLFFCLIFYLIENEIILSRIFNSRPINLDQSAVTLHSNTNTLGIVSNFTTVEYYLYSFIRPVILWNEQSLFTKLIGSGNSIDGLNVFVGGDFAYGAMLLFSGFLFTFFFTVLILKSAYNLLILKHSNQFEEKFFQYFSLVVILLFSSLVHYGQAITNSGIILFFAFHISIVNLMAKDKIKFVKT